MTIRLFSYDPLTKTSVYHHYDHDSKKTYLETVQDVEGILKHCKTLANDSSYKRQGIKEEYYHFATVPNTVLLKIKAEHNLDYNKREDLPKIEVILKRDYKKLLTVDKI